MKICYIKTVKLEKTIKNIIKTTFNIIEIEKIEEDRYIYNIPYINYKNQKLKIRTSTMNKVNRLIKNNNIEAICISNSMKKYIEYFKGNNIFVLEGRWLFKSLLNNVLEYLSFKMNNNFSSVTILINEPTDSNVEIIKSITKKIKTLKIVTNNISKFKFLEEKLYNEQGIAIIISNNKKKALLKSNIIVNLEFNEEELLKYDINRKAIIININNQIKQYSKSFSGISINNYNINLSKEYIELFKKYKLYKEFPKSILYESMIIKKESLDNIIKKINKDNISICNLVGNNGIINDREYKDIKL